MTRAEQELHLSSARLRTFRGVTNATVSSSFLRELPRAEMEWTDASRGQYTLEREFAGPRSVPPTLTPSASPPRTAEIPPAASASAASRTPSKNAPLTTADQLDLPLEPRPPAAASQGHRQPTSSVVPAAAAAASAPSTEVDPDQFVDGMVVLHPQYGPGKVTSLSGRGPNRRATVKFPTHGQKSFVISKSPLRPAR